MIIYKLSSEELYWIDEYSVSKEKLIARGKEFIEKEIDEDEYSFNEWVEDDYSSDYFNIEEIKVD